MDSSFNSEDDLDLIKEIECINSINSDVDLNDNKSKQTNSNNNTKPSINTQPEKITETIDFSKPISPKTPRKKRRSPKKTNFAPKIDLDALLGPSENIFNDDNNDFLDLSPRKESMISSPKESIEVTNTSFSLTEERIMNHANQAFQKLTEDFLFELKSLFEDDYHLQNIIYTYLMSLLSDIRSEIRFVNESVEFPQIDFNIDLDINSLNIHKSIIKNNFQIHQYIDQISELKSSLSQNIKKSQNNLDHEIQSRDNEVMSTSKISNSKLQYMEQLMKKEHQMQKRLFELNFSLELYEIYNSVVKQKIEDLETAETLKQQKIDSSVLIQQNLEQLQDEISHTNINSENKRLLNKVKQIIDEKKEIQQSIDSLFLSAKTFFTFPNNSSYNNNYSMNYQSRSFSAPFTPRSPIVQSPKSGSPSNYDEGRIFYGQVNQTPDHYIINKSDSPYTQTSFPGMLNPMNYNMNIPNYI